MALLAHLHRFNQRHPWSHNDHYGRWIADRVAASGARHVLDVGCGTGNLAARLRRRAVTVTGLEPDPGTARAAAERFTGDPAVTIVEAAFDGRDPGRRYDAVTLVAVLHHLPLTPTLRELRRCLAPGGRLVILGCYRESGPVDLLATLPAALLNPVLGLIRHPARADAPPPHMTAPTADPRETLGDIRAAAARELPGARIRRRLFWRYSLVYDAPPEVPAGGPGGPLSPP
ncbi:class I SAM-dependent methyltransferase [Streptomyces sp. AN091965]|uniref:class I SAM-dependent methyltransferase n=1 Tax=Streptomyces sp. AN091965 TaxID=2927803 RepID=UPI001F61F41A|nr:class I SAM-dependent methyltransferase [Streptomyces sp. AN091965]MCI3928739.1 class I SAM-dependent methyltransferase [Streptomyces sp. AN091965]